MLWPLYFSEDSDYQRGGLLKAIELAGLGQFGTPESQAGCILLHGLGSTS